MQDIIYDVAVIGGGAAGLAAATVLARANSKVIVVDAGKQSNSVSHAAGAVFTRDGTAPKELYRIAREQLLVYPSASLVNDVAVSVTKGKLFSLELESGVRIHARLLLLAQGMTYALPEINGIRELWGNKVWHCPYCHGYEAKGKKVLVIMDDERRDHVRSILPSWTRDFSFIGPDEVESVSEESGKVVVRLRTGGDLIADEIMVQTLPVSRDAITESLGCAVTEQGHLLVDSMGKTTVPGVYAAGDQSSQMKQFNLSVASGHVAGVAMHQELCSSEQP